MLDAAVDAGIAFYDTADVYRDGRSESLVGAFRADRSRSSAAAGHPLFVATKVYRRARIWAWTRWTWCSFTARRRRRCMRTTVCSNC